MMVLGIETSTLVCGVGLVDEEGLNRERSLEEAHIHSERLLVLMKDVLHEARRDLASIEGVAVSIGPGSFTGLRIGLSTAKGLSYALGKPLILVPTFDAIAEAAFTSTPKIASVLVVMDAKREDYYVGRFVKKSGVVQATCGVEVLALHASGILKEADERTLVVTDQTAIIKKELPQGVRCADVHQFCRPAVVARLGLAKAHRKEFADLASAEPMYLKDFVVKNPARSMRPHVSGG